MDITGWFCAAEAGDLEHIKETCIQFVGKVNERGRTALMLAASLGHRSICDFLARFEGRQTTPKGVTALMIAAELQHIDIVAVLAPYESRMRSDKAEPAIIRAARHCCMPALEILLPYEMCYASECLAVAKLIGWKRYINGLMLLSQTTSQRASVYRLLWLSPSSLRTVYYHNLSINPNVFRC